VATVAKARSRAPVMTHPADGTAQSFLYAVRPLAHVLYTPEQRRTDCMRYFRCTLAAARRALHLARVARGLGSPDLVAFFMRDAQGYHRAAIEWLRKAQEIAA
jgi:hypothetical protein